MPEIPDFEQIASALIDRITADGSETMTFGPSRVDNLRDVAEQLRQAWNARGAADLAKIETELSMLMGVTAAGPYLKNLDRALRTLDR